MHVVAHTDARGLGGAELSLAHLVAGTSARVTVVGHDEAVVARVASGRAAHVVPPLALPALLARLRPDVVHANLHSPWACAPGLAAALALPRARVVAVQQLPMRTTRLPLWWRTRALALRLDAHVAVGEASARRVEDFYALGRGSVRSIGNLVPDRGQLPVEAHGGYVVGAVGRLDAVKDHALLLRAAARVGARVVIVGEGSQRAALRRQAEDLGVDLQLAGWVDDPWQLLTDADVIALPSRTEGWPLTLVEAALAGRAVVATRVGSVPEVVRDGETGLLVAPGDEAELVGALARLRDDAALRGRLAGAARECALATMTVDRMVAAYDSLWSEVVSRPRAARLRVGLPRA